MPNKRVTVVGAGLAGSEAAFRLARNGVAVDLYDMKPHKKSPAHKSDDFAELVCSNSLRSDRIENAVGLLKAEMRELGSLVIAAADRTRVPAGGALAVDREGFAQAVTAALLTEENITVHAGEIQDMPDAPCIIATGPLTSDALSESIGRMVGKQLHFYDAAAPIVSYDSLDHDKVFRASRYGRGEDYLNCPMTREEYFAFYRELITAKTAPLHDFETPRVFEGCMPVETMAKRGEMTLCYGPLKPVGLLVENKRPFAVVQLRQDDAAGRLYNLVGFQTNLTFPEQRRVFGMIPGLEHAEFVRYGVMHRNTFINSPGFLDKHFSMLEHPLRFFAGQLSGVEGYVESTSSGLLAGLTMAARLQGMPDPEFSPETAIGALGQYVSTPNKHFQPMNINFGLLPPLDKRVRGKQNRYAQLAQRALAHIGQTIQQRTDLFS